MFYFGNYIKVTVEVLVLVLDLGWLICEQHHYRYRYLLPRFIFTSVLRTLTIPNPLILPAQLN